MTASMPDQWAYAAPSDRAHRAMTSTARPTRPREFARLSYVALGEGGGQLHLSLHGEIDLAAEELLRDTLEKVTAVPPCDITVDLAGVTFFSSIGLNMLAGLNNHVAATGHTVTVSNPARIVLRTLQLSGFDQVVTVTGS
jgi:anti-anti-sigma factor